MTSTRYEIPSGDLGTEATVAEMQRIICEAALTPRVRRVAVDIVARVGDDGLAQLLAIRDWVQNHFHFVRDPSSGELIHTLVGNEDSLFAQIDRNGAARGDCDDAAVLAGALACSVGFQVALIVVGFDPNGPFSHVWASASPPYRCVNAAGKQVWIDLDVTRPMQDIPLDRLARRQATRIC